MWSNKKKSKKNLKKKRNYVICHWTFETAAIESLTSREILKSFESPNANILFDGVLKSPFNYYK